MFLITIIGVIASVGGAGISVWQATRARSAANEAKRIRSQLIDQRKTSELSQVQTICKMALRAMEKYGPASTPSSSTPPSFAGVLPESDATAVQNALFLLRENRDLFGSRAPNEADEFCDVITPLLDSFSSSNDWEGRRQNGKQIATHLSTFLSVVKRTLERKQESIR